MKAVVLVSGGLDSTTLLHYVIKKLNYEVKALTILYGQKHSIELEYAKWQCGELNIEHDILDLSVIKPFLSSSSLVGNTPIPDVKEVLGDPQPSTYVPNRNMIFLSIAAGYAENIGANKVFYGAQRHDLYGYFDTTSEFLDRINHVLQLNRKNTVQIEAPFVEFKKSDIIKVGLELGVDYSKTYSCYSGNDKPSRRSATSAERIKAFQELGLEDPLEYAD